jgi:PAS domain S-box-containing protein
MNTSQASSKVNILLIDDHPANLMALSSVLSEPTYNLVTATSGQAALSCLLKMEFAVILLDVMMPSMDGFEVAHIMKSRDATRHIPIIFITAVATDIRYIFRGYSIGAVDYIQKPFEPEIIKAKVAVFADLFKKNEYIRKSEKAEYLKKEHEGRVRAERAEDRFRAITNSLDHSIIWESNLDLSSFSFVSQRAVRLLGYSLETWMNEPNFFLSHIPSDDQAKVLSTISHVRNPPSTSDELGERCEHRLTASDGVERWFHTAIQYFQDEENSLQGLRGLSVEIHALKSVEFALRDSQERLDFALKASNLGMWDWNLITGHFIASDTFKWLFGFSALEFPEDVEDIRKRIHPEDRDRTRLLVDHAKEAAENYETEYRIILPDGRIRWIASKGKAFLDSNQKPVRMTGTVTDITEKKEVEERNRFISDATLQLSSTLDYQKTLRGIADLLVPKIASWCIIDLIQNDALERAIVLHSNPLLAPLAKRFESLEPDLNAPSGSSRAIKSGKSVLFPPAKMDEALNNIEEVPMIGTRDPEQLEMIKAFGLRSYISVLIQLRNVQLGVITLVRGPHLPVFQEKDLEFLEDLAQRAALAIDNSRLYLESQKAIKTREDVVSFVSHDLKNPLSAISLSSKMLEKLLSLGETGEKSKRVLQRIQTSTQGMNNLINSILDLSKIGAWGLTVHSNPENIRSLIDEALESAKLGAFQKSVCLSKELDPTLGELSCDRHQISRVLANLISNAIKFSPKGGNVAVSVQTLREELIFSVSDEGPGIPPEQQGRVFERFWQAKETAHQGTGLGLVIVKEIVEAHQGKIWIESQLGKGTTFYFSLPQSKRKAA